MARRPIQLLDAIAFAALPEELLVIKLAARFWDVSVGYGLTDINSEVVAKWVRKSFGPIFEPGHEPRLIHATAKEIVRQRLISTRRWEQRGQPLENSIWARRGRLLKSVLGPADRWATKKVLGDSCYVDALVRDGLVVGLVRTDSPVTGSASLLVFRPGRGEEPQSHWVNRTNSIEDALHWLAGPAVSLAEEGGSRVEVDWRRGRFRVISRGGRVRYLAWRERWT